MTGMDFVNCSKLYRSQKAFFFSDLCPGHDACASDSVTHASISKFHVFICGIACITV